MITNRVRQGLTLLGMVLLITQLHALHRFNPAIEIIPLTDRFDQHGCGTHFRRRGSGVLRHTLIAAAQLRDEQYHP